MERYLPQLSDRGGRWVRFCGLLLVIALLVWIAIVLRQVLTPIVAALALAYILNPLVTWLEKNYGIRRATSICVGLALLLLLGGGLLVAGTAQIVQLAGDIPDHATAVFEWLDETIPGLLTPAGGRATTQTQPVGIAVERERLVELASRHGLSVGGAIIGYMGRLATNAFYWLSLTVLMPLYAFFFLLQFNQIVRTVHDHLPNASRPTVVRIVTTIDAAISTFFRGRLLVCLVVGSLTGIGWLILRVPYSLALGALAGTLNLVPFLSVLALPPALLLTYLHATEIGANWVVATTLVFGVYLVVQAIESFVLTPTIEARASGLHPVTTVVALLIGGQLAGLLGMLLAIPIASTLKSLAAEYVLPELRRLADTEATGASGVPDEAGVPAEVKGGSSMADSQPPKAEDASPEDRS